MAVSRNQPELNLAALAAAKSSMQFYALLAPGLKDGALDINVIAKINEFEYHNILTLALKNSHVEAAIFLLTKQAIIEPENSGFGPLKMFKSALAYLPFIIDLDNILVFTIFKRLLMNVKDMNPLVIVNDSTLHLREYLFGHLVKSSSHDAFLLFYLFEMIIRNDFPALQKILDDKQDLVIHMNEENFQAHIKNRGGIVRRNEMANTEACFRKLTEKHYLPDEITEKCCAILYEKSRKFSLSSSMVASVLGKSTVVANTTQQDEAAALQKQVAALQAQVSDLQIELVDTKKQLEISNSELEKYRSKFSSLFFTLKKGLSDSASDIPEPGMSQSSIM